MNKKKCTSIGLNNILSKTLILTGKSKNQKLLIKTIKDNVITFVSGPPGTGKTHISVCLGLESLIKGECSKLVFTRPCVEAYGENLGFLPGDFYHKISPYMIPVFGILSQYLDKTYMNRMMDEGTIDTLPLAFQRGVTFNDAFVVADEMQNASPQQVRLVLTRIGKNCKMVLAGDLGQSDIRGQNGLSDAVERLQGVGNIGFTEMESIDIVRSDIVRDIDARYLADE